MELQYVIQLPYPPKTKHQSNYISTTKYNLITFLPLSLILQFTRYANIYFLICAILQSIPLISPLSPFSAVTPLIFVLALSMCRQGYEDYKRWKSDRTSNSSRTSIYKEQLISTEWKDVKVGDFIRINRNQQLPADVLQLISSSPSGIAYLETSSLDGEKNLKPKISLVDTQLYYNQSQLTPKFEEVQLIARCLPPNANVSQFEAKLSFNTKALSFEAQANHKNILLRGCKLRNTEWIIGVTIYTGQNTKLMKNSGNNSNKRSNIERKVNIIILFILAFEVLCSGISAIYCYVSCNQYINFQKLITSPPMTCLQIGGISFASYFILYSTFIPISLIVSLEFVKLFQGYAMSIDKQMHCVGNDRSLECHTVSINEELGQIEYILTDKTGTLTCNSMEFRSIIVGNQTYGEDTLPQIDINFDYEFLLKRVSMSQQSSLQSIKQFDSRPINYQLQRKDDDFQSNHKHDIQLIFFMITTCHECLKDGESYQGPSPDQVALLIAAKNIGFEFINTQNNVTTVKYKENNCQFEILKVFEFDADRKRMSVIIKYKDVVKVFVKGADSSIEPLLLPNQKYLNYIKDKSLEMAKVGLRCLWFAHKSIPTREDYSNLTFQQVEKDLNIIGATAIEDKLQDYVPETIHSLREGGIKFVMLTGDKLQTADNIARSCKLIQSGYLIRSDEALKERVKYLKQNPDKANEFSPVVDGSVVKFKQLQQQIAYLLHNSKSAVFCRVTPGQKAQIVKIVKSMDKITLAIGDGANDTNMIMEAHVGVGIFGNEGTRAAQVSNYAIGEFCLLWKLLLYYGRLNYIRIAEMILYFFYKNMVFTIVQFGYSFYNLGSGQSFWLSWSITFYNMIFTLLPVVLRAVFQVDLDITSNKDTFKELTAGSHSNQVLYSYYPKMYHISQKNTLFTGFIFFEWYVLGICQGIIILLITIYSLGSEDDTNGPNSLPTGFYFCQISAYTSVILVVTIKLALNVKNWNILLVLSFIIPSIGAYILYCYASNAIGLSIVQDFVSDLLLMPTFYATQILCIFGMFSFDCFLFSLQATKKNFKNYLMYRSVRGKRLSETNLKSYWLEMETQRKSQK